MQLSALEDLLYTYIHDTTGLPQVLFPNACAKPKGDYVGVGMLNVGNETLNILNTATRHEFLLQLDVATKRGRGLKKNTEYIDVLQERFKVGTVLQNATFAIEVVEAPTVTDFSEQAAAYYVRSLTIDIKCKGI